MSGRNLGAAQVAVMLTSASYGIGFLFGSGEHALSHVMAGAVYGLATALGMLMMAAFAAPLWHSGQAVWDLFTARCGPSVGRLVALLSLIWMSGVLAAQIHGAAAVAGLLGLSPMAAYAVPCILILAASRLNLRAASSVFSLCLAASAVVLVGALVAEDGLGVYARALPTFVDDVSRLGGGPLLAITIAVSLLACLGADYHQFVLDARSARAARRGCLLAALLLALLSFLPPALVVAAVAAPGGVEIENARQVVPFLLQAAAARVGPALAPLMLVMLALAALGSGAAVLRAMTSAIVAGSGARPLVGEGWVGLIGLGMALVLASRQASIVETMVSVNLVYVATVGVSLVAILRGHVVPERREACTLATGFLASAAVLLCGSWLAGPSEADLVSVAVRASAAAMVRFGSRARRTVASRPHPVR